MLINSGHQPVVREEDSLSDRKYSPFIQFLSGGFALFLDKDNKLRRRKRESGGEQVYHFHKSQGRIAEIRNMKCINSGTVMKIAKITSQIELFLFVFSHR